MKDFVSGKIKLLLEILGSLEEIYSKTINVFFKIETIKKENCRSNPLFSRV